MSFLMLRVEFACPPIVVMVFSFKHRLLDYLVVTTNGSSCVYTINLFSAHREEKLISPYTECEDMFLSYFLFKIIVNILNSLAVWHSFLVRFFFHIKKGSDTFLKICRDFMCTHNHFPSPELHFSFVILFLLMNENSSKRMSGLLWLHTNTYWFDNIPVLSQTYWY